MSSARGGGRDPERHPDDPTSLPGPLRFQLVLLRRMADHQPGLVEDALRELGAGKAEMREANRRWQAMIRSPRARGALQRYRSLLGPPHETVRRRIGDLDCDALRWPVPLWPDLRFEVLTAPGGQVWNEWLVRTPGDPGPRLRTVADLRPWSCTVDEVARAFPPATPMEGTAPTRFRLAFTAPEGTGPGGREADSGEVEGGVESSRGPETDAGGPETDAGGRGGARHVAEFTWGLLQRLDP